MLPNAAERRLTNGVFQVNVVRHGIDDHRLAKELESRGQLLSIVRSEIEKALGLRGQDVDIPVKAKIWYT